MAEKAEILVVANRTAGSPELIAALKERADRGPAKFHLLVPATPHGVAWAGALTSGGSEAESRVRAAGGRLRAEGREGGHGQGGAPGTGGAVAHAVNSHPLR